MNKKILALACVATLWISCHAKSAPQTFFGAKQAPFSQITLGGELIERVNRNFNRLEETKYQPDNVFLTEEQSGGWPGDTEGRTILALVLDAQASHRSPIYLDEIMKRIPAHLNERGYMGPIYEGKANEQQLSGNGWMLRALCEYYRWKPNEQTLSIIRSIASNLFLQATTHYATYPIDPAARTQNVGAESGNIVGTEGSWMLSTDIGCVFIGMDGLIDAYSVTRQAELRKPIEILIDKFLAVNLTGIKAQTHATLTACRGLLRYADIVGNSRYVDEAAKRFRLYVANGMTENYENYNWFDRFDTWTEPCAIVDSYMLAVQLWQHTGDPYFLEYAERIYYNAICHTQRQNGGFGCDNCPGKTIGTQSLAVHAAEAHWCCTMRGGEGLSSAVAYTAFTRRNEVYLPFYHQGQFNLTLKGRKTFSFEQQTSYPFGSEVSIRVKENTAGAVTLHLGKPSWLLRPVVEINGKVQSLQASNGFLAIKRKFRSGDVVKLSFQQRLGFEKVENPVNMRSEWHRIFYGPLLLAAPQGGTLSISPQTRIIDNGDFSFTPEGTNLKLTPIYHFLDKQVWTGTGYSRQILF